MLDNYNDILNFDELCTILGISCNPALTLLKTQKIKAFKIGRIWKIPKISVEDYILENIKNTD
ncbi:MAG: helix-turn-helix domain-containing protein [Clostridiales bacterium]|nr:helix-turn-helix domain-containing protein [Clostridiales bacterium]